MKQVTMESVKQRISELTYTGVQSLRGEFELACLRELVAMTEQRDAVVAESSGIQKRMQQLVDIINKADNYYCMCGDAMKNHGHGGCSSPIGMFDYHYGRWVESETETPATDVAIAALRAEGVEMFASDIGLVYQQLRKGSLPAKALKDVVMRATSFARQLRESKGANHE